MLGSKLKYTKSIEVTLNKVEGTFQGLPGKVCNEGSNA